MKRSRLKIVILIFVIVLIAVVFLIHRSENKAENHQPGSIETAVEEHSSQEEASSSESLNDESVALTSEEWNAIVLNALKSPNLDAEISITPENTMTITCDLPKETISEWLDEADEDSKEMYRSILSILPDSLPTTLTCSINCEDGEIQLAGESMTVSNIDVPMDVLDGVWDSVNDNLNLALQEKTDGTLPSISSFSIQDGSILLQ
jgi:hypothetical protein